MVSSKVKVDHLSTVPLFRACPKRDLRRLARHVDEVEADEGVVLVEEGRSGREFFVLLDGEVRVSRRGRNVGRLGPGDVFGELALLVDYPRTATVTATSPVDLLVLDRPAFKAALEELPGMATKMLEVLAGRLAEATRPV